MSRKAKPNAIKHWREKRGFTQKELAAKIGLDKTKGQVYISRWENNQTSPSVQSLVKLSKALRVKITELL